MAVTTSQVTTASNGDLSINPNGSGKVKFSKLTGGSLPTGVLTDGTVQHFRVDQLAGAGTVDSNTVVMVQKSGETVVKKSSIADIVAAGGGGGGGGLTLTDFSVSTGAASNGGALAYNNTNGVFTYNPASLSDMGGITLGSLSVSVAAASGGGSLSYDSSNGVFTFIPADLSGLGGGSGGGITYSGTNGVGFVSGSATQFQVDINSLATR